MVISRQFSVSVSSSLPETVDRELKTRYRRYKAVLPQFTKFKGAALNLLFPQKCLGCGIEGELLCASCLKSLPRIVPPICPKCGRPQPSGIICPGCINWQSRINGIRSPLRFDGLTRQAIHQLKYKNLRSISKLMAIILHDYLQQNSIPSQVLIPVPLHPKRLKERGYNQSALLAQELSKLVNLPVVDDCLVRNKFILPQALTQSVEERRKNVKQAFSCRDSRLQGKQVLLIDDVTTSGATLDACAIALISSGVASVWGLTLAREI